MAAHPYRTSEAPALVEDLFERWRVTWWQKLYVRIARRLFDIRAPYLEGREWRKYMRARLRWDALPMEERTIANLPLPPPRYILE